MSQSVRDGQAHSAWVAWLMSPIGTAIVALGITQIIAWGTTLYALGVLAAPIAADTGWSRSLVFSGLTVGLLVSGFVSTAVGKAIDERGGQLVMSLGSVLCAAISSRMVLNCSPSWFSLRDSTFGGGGAGGVPVMRSRIHAPRSTGAVRFG